MAGAQSGLPAGLTHPGEGTRKCANAETLSAAVVGASPRVLPRFLTAAKWDDQAVLRQLQVYLAPRLSHPEAVWAVDDSSFPKQGKKSAGVARQYCGALGKVANCQSGVFLASVSPRGRALVDKRLFLPHEWTDDPTRCPAAGVPEERRIRARPPWRCCCSRRRRRGIWRRRG